MGNRIREPKELKIIDSQTIVTVENAIAIGSGADPSASAVYQPLDADVITVLAEINTGSVIIQRALSNALSTNWEDIATLLATGSIVLTATEDGLMPRIRVVGSSGPASAGGSVFADIMWKTST